MRVMILLMNEGNHNAMLGAENKSSKIEDDEWMDLVFMPKPLLYYA